MDDANVAPASLLTGQTMSGKLLAKGAEAEVYKITLDEGKVILLKNRSPKSYRHPALDFKLRSERAKSEFRILQKLFDTGLRVPKPLSFAYDACDVPISMQFIDGPKLRDALCEEIHEKTADQSRKNVVRFAKLVATQLEQIHNIGIIHGDPTSSNMIVFGDAIYFIDFGLAYHSTRVEDRAVDLHILKQAIIAHHTAVSNTFIDAVLETYSNEDVKQRLAVVEQRGRNKLKE